MFGIFSKEPKIKNNLPDSLNEFLDDAEEAYVMTHKQRNMKYVAKMFSRQLYMDVHRSLQIERPWVFVSDKFKTLKWSLVEKNENTFRVKKDVQFDKVRINKNFKMSVAQDYVELWEVVKEGREYTVVSIKPYN